MSGSSTDTRRARADAPVGAGAAQERGSARAPAFPTVALALVLAVAGWTPVAAAVLLVDRPTPLPPPLSPQNQDAETLAYLLAYFVVLPAALLGGGALATAIARRRGAASLSVLTGGLAASLFALVPAVKLAGALGAGDGVGALLAVTSAWWAVAAVLLYRATRLRPWPLLAWLAPWATRAWALAAAAAFVAVAALTNLSAIRPLGLAVGVLAAAAVVAIADRVPARLPRPWLVALELAIVALLVLAVPDLVVFRPEQAPGNVAVSLETSIIRFHQNFLLGPADEVLGGGAMLVDTASQYGVGSIYLLAAWFKLAPIGYGTLALLDGLLTAAWFAAGYAVLRMAGVSRTLASCALGLGVVALIFNLTYPVGGLPQYGPLRFGMPMALILALLAAQRWPRLARPARAAALAVTGLSAVFSLEALAYTTAVYAAVIGVQAWLRPGPGRLRWLARQAAAVVLAWVAAHVAFALATLAATGRLPDWWQYLVYLHAFLFGPIGSLTYDVPHWTPGLAVGAGYLASAMALAELARRRHPLVALDAPVATALTGLTAYGIVLLSYWDNRSQEHILVHVALPALLLGTLWLSLLWRARTAPRAARLGGLAFGAAVAALVLAAAWPSIGARFPRSALAHAAPGGESLHGALQRLWHPPALDPAALVGQRVLAQYMPGERRSLVMTAPDLSIEILLRSDRESRLLLGDPQETSFVAQERLPDLRRQLARLRPGERMLMDRYAQAALRAFVRDPSVDPLRAQGLGIAPIQAWTLNEIRRRFALRPVAREQGFTVVQLAPRAP